MQTFLIQVLIFCLMATPVWAKPVNLVKEYTYQASELDSKVQCRINALHSVKRLLLEELGTYLESETEVRDSALERDQIITYTAGLVSATVIDEKWNGVEYYLKASVTANTEDVAKGIAELRKNKVKSKELEEARLRAQAAEKEAIRLRAKPAGMSEERRQAEYNKSISIINNIDKLVAGVLSIGFSLLDEFLKK